MSPEAPERHSRVFLHRCYLEVSAASSGCGWEATLFFLRFDDPETLRAHLEDVGIAYRFSGYDGVDGAWDDVELRVVTVPLPMLVRRTAPPAVAREVPSLEEAVEACGRLLGAGQVAWADSRRARGQASARLASGEIVLHEGVSGAGLGLVLGVPSLAATRTALEGRVACADEDVAWLDRDEPFGLRLGFAELEGRPAGPSGLAELAEGADERISFASRRSIGHADLP